MKMSKRDVAEAKHFHDVLQQRRWWRQANGNVVRRRDLDINHKVNILAKLLRDAQQITDSYAGMPVFNAAPDDVWDELDQMLASPQDWMAQTPMWRALLQDVMSFADIGPEDLGLTPHRIDFSGRAVWLEKR